MDFVARIAGLAAVTTSCRNTVVGKWILPVAMIEEFKAELEGHIFSLLNDLSVPIFGCTSCLRCQDSPSLRASSTSASSALTPLRRFSLGSKVVAKSVSLISSDAECRRKGVSSRSSLNPR